MGVLNSVGRLFKPYIQCEAIAYLSFRNESGSLYPVLGKVYFVAMKF